MYFIIRDIRVIRGKLLFGVGSSIKIGKCAEGKLLLSFFVSSKIRIKQLKLCGTFSLQTIKLNT